MVLRTSEEHRLAQRASEKQDRQERQTAASVVEVMQHSTRRKRAHFNQRCVLNEQYEIEG